MSHTHTHTHITYTDGPMDISGPVSRARARRLLVSLEVVTSTTSQKTSGARRHCPLPAGGGRQHDVLQGHNGGTPHL